MRLMNNMGIALAFAVAMAGGGAFAAVPKASPTQSGAKVTPAKSGTAAKPSSEAREERREEKREARVRHHHRHHPVHHTSHPAAPKG